MYYNHVCRIFVRITVLKQNAKHAKLQEWFCLIRHQVSGVPTLLFSTTPLIPWSSIHLLAGFPGGRSTLSIQRLCNKLHTLLSSCRCARIVGASSDFILTTCLQPYSHCPGPAVRPTVLEAHQINFVKLVKNIVTSAEGGYVFTSVCLSVCPSDNWKVGTDFAEISWRGRAWPKNQWVQFWWRSRSRSPKSEIRIHWIIELPTDFDEILWRAGVRVA